MTTDQMTPGQLAAWRKLQQAQDARMRAERDFSIARKAGESNQTLGYLADARTIAISRENAAWGVYKQTLAK